MTRVNFVEIGRDLICSEKHDVEVVRRRGKNITTSEHGSQKKNCRQDDPCKNPSVARGGRRSGGSRKRCVDPHMAAKICALGNMILGKIENTKGRRSCRRSEGGGVELPEADSFVRRLCV